MDDKLERLAVAQAVYKAIAPMVETKNRDNLRGVCDEEFIDLYHETGATSRKLEINGVQIGTYSLVFNKATESSIETQFRIKDRARLDVWVENLTDAELREYAHALKEELATYVFESTGEVADGCDLDAVYMPGTDATIKGTNLKVDPQAVARALPESAPYRPLLMGGE